MNAYNCPKCGRFSSDCWYRVYLDEFGGDYGGTCAVHGPWSDGA